MKNFINNQEKTNIENDLHTTYFPLEEVSNDLKLVTIINMILEQIVEH